MAPGLLILHLTSLLLLKTPSDVKLTKAIVNLRLLISPLSDSTKGVGFGPNYCLCSAYIGHSYKHIYSCHFTRNTVSAEIYWCPRVNSYEAALCDTPAVGVSQYYFLYWMHIQRSRGSVRPSLSQDFSWKTTLGVKWKYYCLSKHLTPSLSNMIYWAETEVYSCKHFCVYYNCPHPKMITTRQETILNWKVINWCGRGDYLLCWRIKTGLPEQSRGIYISHLLLLQSAQIRTKILTEIIPSWAF